MKDTVKRLKALCLSTGVAGLEFESSKIAASMLKEYASNACVDDFGNVMGLIKCGDKNAKTILLDAHIDEIGMIVTSVDDKGFIKFSKCGGVDLRILSAQKVTIHGKKDISGVVGSKPPHLETKEEADKIPDIEDMYIDVGCNEEAAKKLIEVGDRITIDVGFDELLNGRVCCKALDDRAGVVGILHALSLTKGKKLKYNVAVQFSTKEETGGQGAKTSAYVASPDMAIAVDVSFAKTPDSPPDEKMKLGEGAMIGYHPILDKEMTDELLKIAKAKKIKFQLEGMGGGRTGTNADEIILTKSGVRTALISIPQRYMHTPIEVCDIKDIEAVGNLIAEFIVKGK